MNPFSFPGLRSALTLIFLGALAVLVVVRFIRDARRERKLGPAIQTKTPSAVELENARLNWRAPPELCAPPPRQVRMSAFAWVGVAIAEALLLPFVYLTCESALVAETRMRDPELSAVSAGVCVALGAAILYGIRRGGRLLEWGQPAAAVLTEVRARAGGSALRNLRGDAVVEKAFVRYQFKDASGKLQRGGGNYASNASPGQVVTIVYDPEHPERHALYPVAEFIVRG